MKATILALTFILFPPCDNPVAFSQAAQAQTRLQPNTPEWEAMWKKCRRAVFRKYGTRQRERKRYVMPSQRAVALTDACMASGGRLL
jgi:hypothetical protein